MELNYHRDTDGLRAVAVLLVVFNHASFSAFGSSYSGVDVFFVISGYLITGNVAPDLAQDRFSFADFQLRRARQLLPAFVAMVLISRMATACSLLPWALIRYSNSLLVALLSIANMFFWRISIGSFLPGADQLPLLSTTCRRARGMLPRPPSGCARVWIMPCASSLRAAPLR